jgi:acyl carrier protein
MGVAITKPDIDAIFPRVAKAVAEALARDAAEVKINSRLFADLEAESIDLLDIVFRLEREFKIQIPRGRILEDARGDLPETEFENNGVLTAAGLARLRDYLSEVPAQSFRPQMNLADVPSLFTVETMCKMVIRAIRAGGA